MKARTFRREMGRLVNLLIDVAKPIPISSRKVRELEKLRKKYPDVWEYLQKVDPEVMEKVNKFMEVSDEGVDILDKLTRETNAWGSFIYFQADENILGLELFLYDTHHGLGAICSKKYPDIAKRYKELSEKTFARRTAEEEEELYELGEKIAECIESELEKRASKITKEVFGTEKKIKTECVHQSPESFKCNVYVQI